jgi:hypothetical protein
MEITAMNPLTLWLLASLVLTAIFCVASAKVEL